MNKRGRKDGVKEKIYPRMRNSVIGLRPVNRKEK